MLYYTLEYKYNGEQTRMDAEFSQFRHVYDRANESLLMERNSKLLGTFQEVVEHLIREDKLPWELLEDFKLLYPGGEYKSLDKEKKLVKEDA